MNTIDLYVTEVLGEPIKHEFSLGEFYTIDVMADAYGSVQKTTVTTKTLEEAKKVKPGYVFQG